MRTIPTYGFSGEFVRYAQAGTKGRHGAVRHLTVSDAGTHGFGYSYTGWKVSSLDGGAYVHSMLPKAWAGAVLDPATHKPTIIQIWRDGLLVLSDQDKLLRLELATI